MRSSPFNFTGKGELCMRLDKYLKVSRLIKRRTVANEACDAGRVTINGRPAKASAEVKAGDVLEIRFGNRDVKVRVKDVKETIHKEDAAEMFEYI
jgi:ribosomal 50S subunit-recycling heat shock protein